MTISKLNVQYNGAAYYSEEEVKPGWNITYHKINLDGTESFQAFWRGPGNPVLTRGEKMKSKEVGDKFYVVKENSVKDKSVVYIDEEIFKKVKGFVDLFKSDFQFNEHRKLHEENTDFTFRYSLECLKNLMGWSRHGDIYNSLVYLLEVNPDATKH